MENRIRFDTYIRAYTYIYVYGCKKSELIESVLRISPDYCIVALISIIEGFSRRILD